MVPTVRRLPFANRRSQETSSGIELHDGPEPSHVDDGPSHPLDRLCSLRGKDAGRQSDAPSLSGAARPVSAGLNSRRGWNVPLGDSAADETADSPANAPSRPRDLLRAASGAKASGDWDALVLDATDGPDRLQRRVLISDRDEDAGATPRCDTPRSDDRPRARHGIRSRRRVDRMGRAYTVQDDATAGP